MSTVVFVTPISSFKPKKQQYLPSKLLPTVLKDNETILNLNIAT
jgi:hypothetical protein